MEWIEMSGKELAGTFAFSPLGHETILPPQKLGAFFSPRFSLSFVDFIIKNCLILAHGRRVIDFIVNTWRRSHTRKVKP
jgi:hypothetical protein